MEYQSYNEWLAANPGKTINEYYQLTGAKPISYTQEVMPRIVVNESVRYPDNINIKISPLRLFLYTGIVMASTVVWTIVFLAVGYGLANELMKQLFSRLGR